MAELALPLVIAVAGPFYAFALLLTTAGVLKLRDPRPTSGALRAAGLPEQPGFVRIMGLVEVGIGAGGIAEGGRIAAGALGLAYLAFAAFVVVAIARGLPLTSCGCFGKEDTPPSATHIVITALAAGTGAAVAVEPIGPLGEALATQPWGGVPLLLGALVSAYLAYVILTALAGTMSIVSNGPSARGVRT